MEGIFQPEKNEKGSEKERRRLRKEKVEVRWQSVRGEDEDKRDKWAVETNNRSCRLQEQE